ncbi:hypothetical protein DESUT3_35980 [Desulfuromonas versatilis]|uniref:Diguanylate cyclase/phosphodiesterase with PAS/PAC sensor(S) n=1 Tax=Desulfuromonas versatilis TaxID=2802975 RepID=A0ABM8HZN1_9BACT|nr:EAL domain-containing protein [Desulfuromonas versatilis]BCR06529.1 hypothetical protein DESUT3_35980 [Desulfuromonas versatilis]
MQALKNLSLAQRIYRLSATVGLAFLLLGGWLLLQYRSSLIEARKQEVRTLVEAGWQLLESQARLVTDGPLTVEEAQSRALHILRSQRFDNGNYYWVSDTAPRMLMHPEQSLLEGAALDRVRDADGRQLFLEMNRLALSEGGGFVSYRWPQPGGTAPVDKTSYVMLFPEWHWVIGAGYYLDDIDRMLARVVASSGIIVLLVLGGAIMLIVQVTRSIAAPMGKAVQMIEALERGELDHRLNLYQNDEIGRLAKVMDAFADNLQHEILTAFDHLSKGDFSFAATGLIREPLARTNARLNHLVARLETAIGQEREAKAKTDAILAAIGDGVTILDPEKRIIYQNSSQRALLGDQVGQYCFQARRYLGPDCDSCALTAALADGQVHRQEKILQFREGAECHLETTVAPVKGELGQILALVEVTRDQTERRTAEQRLKQSEARYASLFEHNTSVMLVIDHASGAVVDANPAACRFYGYSRQELTALQISDINTLSRDEALREMAAAKAEQRRHFRFRHRLASGETRDVEVFSGPVELEGRSLLYSLVFDVTDRLRAEERVQYLAFHDPLTGLANRTLLSDRLERALAHSRRHGECGALCFLDVDRFKTINDSLGHQAGDQLLQRVAERLQSLLRDSDTLSRPGGDEFILLLQNLDDPDHAARVAERILGSLGHPIKLGDREVYISCSIGISLYPADSMDVDTLIQNADAAMYHAKGQGRNNYQFFQAAMTAKAQERLHLENDLRHALDRGEMQLHYQPQVEAATRKVVGVEALLRWHHPRLGMVSPAQFIPVAEETGQIIRLGEWVLFTACTQAKLWRDAGLPPLRMAVNVSGKQFRQQDFVATVDRVLAETGFDPGCLELEVTESVIMEDVQETIQTLNNLKARGIRLSIDDFGTGYSSLSYLRQFPIDRLKIDRSFVSHLPGSEDDEAIVNAIIGLAATLHLEVIAEGVETDEQVRLLTSWGCQKLQGYFFGKPLPAEALSEMFEMAGA